MKSYKLGVSLSGGGARGFAHLGVLQALYEYEIYPDAIAGVSAGAIAGVFIASGMQPKEAMSILKDRGLFKYSKIRIPKDGFMSLDGLEEMVLEEISQKNIEELKIKLWVVVTNLNKGRTEYIDEGAIHRAIKASASIPILFSPVEINGEMYVDGGVMDNLPVKPLVACCDKILGVSINPLNEEGRLDNLVQIASRVFHLGVNANALENKQKCDLLIEPVDLSGFDLLDSSKSDDLFEVGYEYTMKVLDKKREQKGKIF